MDFQKLAESFSPPAGIFSVRKLDNGRYGDIRIVAGNQKYLFPLEHPMLDVSPEVTAGSFNKFIPNSPYEKYIPKDIGFEDLCIRTAVKKLPAHTYVHLPKPDMWFDIFAMPIDSEEKDVYYFLYSTQPSDPSDIGLNPKQSDSTSEQVLKTCIKLRGTKDFKKTMDVVIKDLRILCGAEVCTIMLMDRETGTCSVLASNKADDSSMKTVTGFVNFYDIALSWVDTIGDSDCLIIQSENDMKYISEINNPWYLTLVESGVNSVVMFPLRHNEETYGFIWATNFDTNHTIRIRELLELTTFFISSEIAGFKMMERMKEISYTDLLTGVMNRNAMNNRVSGIVAGEEYLSVPFGIVFADLNGLKRMNDTQGHSAGDLLLKKASIMLQECFGGSDIYRAGGDEFVVIVPDIGREDFDKKVRRLAEISSDPEGVCCLAVGSHYVDSGCDIRDAMHLADEDMYKNKELFYVEHPERKYR